MSELNAALDRVLPGVRADFDDLLRIPSISADPASAAAVRQSAEATADLFRNCGAPEVEILEVPGGQPAVLATYPAPEGMPTVLLYAHHDVQPTGDLALWTTPPFEPSERDGRLYGRGTADDKAGIAAHLAVLRTYDGEPPVGVKVFVEGEEEIGSPTLGEFLLQYKEKLTADVIVLADSANYEIGIPALTTVLRGLVDCYVEVRTLDHAVHSGVYGGAVPDALTALCRLLGTLHDDSGEVAIAGLVESDDVKLAPYPEDRFRAEAGLLDGIPLLGAGDIARSLWAKPTATVLAMDAPRVVDASNTLQPSARAKVSVRIPPGNDPEVALRAVTDHLLANAPWGVRVEVTPGDIASPAAIDATGPVFDAMREAFRLAWDGAEPVEIGIGGTIPFIAEFAQTFPDASILVTSAGADPECRAHGADESLHLDEFRRAALSEALLLEKLAHS